MNPQEANDSSTNLLERLKIWSAPDPSEEVSLKRAMAQMREEITVIDSQALVLQDQMDALKQRKLQLELELTRSQSLFSPIRRLPLDLLIEVFRYLDFQTELYIERRLGAPAQRCGAIWSRNDAGLVSPVCWSWNTLICSIPHFWTRFVLSVERKCSERTVPHPELLRTIQSMLCTVLKRSMSAPLEIHIEVSSEWPYLDEILSPVLREVHRCKRLVLKIPRQYLADAGLGCLAGSLTHLESMEFEDMLVEFNDEPVDDICHWFSDAPRLQDVTIVDTRPGFFDLPWAQVTSLTVRAEFDAPSAEDLGVALESATSLSTFIFLCTALEAPFERAKVFLPITSLTIGNQANLDYFENYLELPALTSLKICNLGCSISSFMSRIAPTLQRLEVNIYKPEPFPLSFLGPHTYFPELVELLVTSSYDADEDGDGNCATAPEDLDLLSVRCPRLTQFDCSLARAASLESSVQAWAALLSEMEERPGEVQRTRLELDGPVRDTDFAIIQVLRDLISNGTAIEIRLHMSFKYIRTWKLEVSDVERAELFLRKQYLQLDEIFRAY